MLPLLCCTPAAAAAAARAALLLSSNGCLLSFRFEEGISHSHHHRVDLGGMRAVSWILRPCGFDDFFEAVWRRVGYRAWPLLLHHDALTYLQHIEPKERPFARDGLITKHRERVDVGLESI